MKADFPLGKTGQYWIFHFYMSVLRVVDFPMVTAGIPRIFRFGPIYLDFPYES